MDTVRVLLACGAGASSGFLAAAMRKAAKKRGVDAWVEARSETEIGEYVGKVDVVLLGTHLGYQLDSWTQRLAPHGIKVAVIPQLTYATIDGSAALDLALAL